MKEKERSGTARPDYTALNTLLKEVSEEPIKGAVPYFPPGTYLISKTLGVGTVKVTLRGENRNLSAIKCTGTGAAIEVNAADCAVLDLAIGCESGTHAVAVSPGWERCQVSGCLLKGKVCGASSGADGVLFEHNLATGCGTGAATSEAGININAGQRVRIRLNRCEKNAVHGIRYASSGLEGPEIAFNHCLENGKQASEQLTPIAGRGISVTPESGCTGARLIGNRCGGNCKQQTDNRDLLLEHGTGHLDAGG